MEVKYLDKEEYIKWDEFVEQSPQGFIFSKSWWVDLVTNGDFKICVLSNKEEIFAGIVLPFFNTKNIRMPKLTQTMGVLFKDMSEMRLQKKLTNEKEYTNKLYSFFRKDIKSFNICFHYNYNYWLPFFWEKFEQTTRYTYLIDYSKFIPEEEFKSFSKGHKWTINKVMNKSSLKVAEIKDLSEFYEEAKKTYARQNEQIGYSYDLLQRIHNKLMENNNGIMFKICDDEGNIHAVNYFVYNSKEAYYWLGASDINYRDEGGHTYLIWHSINYFKDKVKIFNFGGSMFESIEKNFRNFSSYPQQYFRISKYNNKILRLGKEMLKIVLKRR